MIFSQVSGNDGVGDGTGALVEDAAAVIFSQVTGNDGVGDRADTQVADAAAELGPVGNGIVGPPSGDRHAGETSLGAFYDEKHAALLVGVDRQQLRPGALNVDVAVDDELALLQDDRLAAKARVERDRVLVRIKRRNNRASRRLRSPGV